MTVEPDLAHFPDNAALAAGLAAALRAVGESCTVEVLTREPSEWVSTYPAEVITCRTKSGRRLRLLCKYSGGRPIGTDHRGGVAHEAEVYRQLLHPIKASVPRFYGTYRDPQMQWTWLLLEMREKTYPLDMDQYRMPQAAAWLGRFHAAAEAQLCGSALPFLRRYDMEYYREWARRAAEFAAPASDQYPWMADLCRSVREPFELLLSRPLTVVHGEFTVFNVLVDGETIRPVDWESAAAGPGEIDLCTLVEGWPEKMMRQCINAYRLARWPRGGEGDLDRALDAAYVHLLLRGIGGDPDYTTTERTGWRFDELLLAGRRWGLL